MPNSVDGFLVAKVKKQTLKNILKNILKILNPVATPLRISQ